MSLIVALAPHIHAAVEAKPEGDPFVWTLLGWAFAATLCFTLAVGLFITTFVIITPFWNAFVYYFPKFDYHPPEPAYQYGNRKPVTRQESNKIAKDFLTNRGRKESPLEDHDVVSIRKLEAKVEHEALYTLARARPGMKFSYLIARRFAPEGTQLKFANISKSRAMAFSYETAARWLDVISDPSVFMVPANIHARHVSSQALFRSVHVSDLHEELRKLAKDSTEPVVLAPSSKSGAGKNPASVPAPIYSDAKPKEAFV